MSSVIRQLLPEDAPAYVEVRREALEREPFAFTASPADDRALSLAFVGEAFASSSQATFGAFAPQLVGIVGVRRDAHLKAAHKAHVWGLYVTRTHQGSGLGRALIMAALQFARTLAGVTQVHLSVAESATAAAHLYTNLGFVKWGTEPSALRVGAASVAEHHMVLEFGPRSA